MYSTHWEEHGLRWQYSGIIGGKELIKSNMDTFGDSRFDDMYYQIVDLTQVTDFDVSLHEMRQLAALDKAASLSNPHVKIAVITDNESIQALSMFYDDENDDSPWKTKIFHNINSARSWIKHA